MQIDNEFKSLIPPLTPDEFSGLEQSLINEGCRDAIVLWNNTIIDGHNRYEICTKHGIEFKTTEMDFDSRQDVLNWIISNQLSRRNLTPEMISYLRGKRYNSEKKSIGENQYSDKSGVVIMTTPQKTAANIASELKTSERTIRRDAEFSDAVDTITKLSDTPDIVKKAILSRDSNFTKKDTVKIAVMAEKEPEKAKKIIESVISGESKNSKDAIKSEKKAVIQQKNVEKTEILASPVSKPKIHLADCKDYMTGIDDNSVDLLFTDPPYSTDIENLESFVESWLPLALSKVKPEGRAFICIGAYPKELNCYLTALLNQDKFIVDNPLIWTYRNTLGVTPNMKYNLNYQVILHLYSEKSSPLDKSVTNEMFSVQDINAPDGRLGNRFHTWQKPDELAYRLIRHTTKENDLILDCFACTGTFVIVADKMKRRIMACDNSLENLKIAETRGCNIITGQKI